jgi:hypothetical protein
MNYNLEIWNQKDIMKVSLLTKCGYSDSINLKVCMDFNDKNGEVWIDELASHLEAST